MLKHFMWSLAAAGLLGMAGLSQGAPIISQNFDSYPVTVGPSAAAFGSAATTEGRWFSSEVNTANGGVFAISNAQAHSGSQSLFIDRPTGAWATDVGGRRYDGTPTGAANVDTTVAGTFRYEIWIRRAEGAATQVYLTDIYTPSGPPGDFITGARIRSDGTLNVINSTYSAWLTTNGEVEFAADTWTKLRADFTVTSAGAGTVDFYVGTDSIADHLVGSRAFSGLPATIRNFYVAPESGAIYYDDAVLGPVEVPEPAAAALVAFGAMVVSRIGRGRRA